MPNDLKPITKCKVTKKLIKNKISEYDNVYNLSNTFKENLFNAIIEHLQNKKVYLKDLNCITIHINKKCSDIGFYGKGRYFSLQRYHY